MTRSLVRMPRGQWWSRGRTWPAIAAIILTSCGAGYDGPLYVSGADADHPRPLMGSGAAGYVIECDHAPYRGGSSEEDEGTFPDAASPKEAVRAFATHEYADLPSEGYELERREESRALFTYDVDGRTKIAVVVAESTSGRWRMEVFAQCDPAEFPPSVDDELGNDIWTTEAGDSVPVRELTLTQGHAHCGRESVTFLWRQTSAAEEEGEYDRYDLYVRDPEDVVSGQNVLPGKDLLASFDADTPLPDDAEDTGYRLDDWSLWLAADNSSAYIVTADGVERWPRANQPFGCI